MSYQIADYKYYEFSISDGIRTWYIPKFRNIMTVSEPFLNIYWTDREKGTAPQRSLTLDYNDILFGVVAPTSAFNAKILIEALINKAWNDRVPYTGATGDVDLNTHGLTADFVAFSQTPTTGPGHAQIGYVGATQALAYDFDNTNVRCNIGQQMYAYVKNDEAVTITKGQAVYLFGASGNKATVKLAINTSDATSATTLGLAAENIAAGQNGLVITQGVLDGINTGAYSPGDILYLGATAGSWTATKPYAPAHLVYIGVVEKANAGAGQIFVRPQNGYELDEIHDVDLITTPPSTGDVLTYNGTLWVNQAPSGGTGTVTSIATTSPITGGTITTSGTIGINNAAADGSTKGAAAFTASDFNDNGSGVISIDYTNGQAASGSNKGFLTSADWTTFNSKFTLPALTSGSVLFSNGTTIAQDNANLFWDDANNRLGIGTNAPANNFVIQSATPFQQIRSTQTSGNGEGGLFITTWNGSAIASVGAFGGTNSTYSSGDISSNGIYITSDRAGGMHFIARSTGTIKFYTAGENLANRRMNIFNNGNVAIGINTDGGFKLDVNGTAQIQGDVTIVALSPFQQIRSTQTTGNGEAGLYFSTYNGSSVVACGGFGGTSSTYSFEDISANGVYLNSSRAGGLHIIARSTGTIKFYTGGQLLANRRMNIFNNGNISIGTNTDGGFKLDVNGTVRFQGDLTIDTKNIITDTTTGSKIGTATTQKIGFWNATPIVQPTTAVAAATFAAVAGGSTIDTNDTFDGYTVGQVVKALRNLGILA